MPRYRTPNGTVVDVRAPVAASLGLQPVDTEPSTAKPAAKRPARPKKPPAKPDAKG